MASFADTRPVQFNQYVGIDEQTYGKILLAKQEQYDQGVAQVQSLVNKTAEFDVMGPDRQAYLKNKVDSLATQLSGRVGADWGTRQLIAEAGGLASQVSKDPIIQNAVISSHNIREQDQRMKKAQDDGKSSAANDYYYLKQRSNYINSGKLDDSFNGQYHQYFDINKTAWEAISKIDPSGTITQDAITVTKDGKVSVDPTALIEVEKKGVSPQAIQQALKGLNLDPNFKQQMVINGTYQYKDYTGDQLLSEAKLGYDSVVKDIDEQINDLKLKQETDKSISSEQIAAYKDQLIQGANVLLREYENSARILQQGGEEALKAHIYSANFNSSIIGARAYETKSEKIVDNPQFNNTIQLRNYELALQKEATDNQHWQADYNLRLREAERQDLLAEYRIAGGGGRGGKGGAGDDFSETGDRLKGIGMQQAPLTTSEEMGINAYDVFVKRRNEVITSMNGKRALGVNELADATGMPLPYVRDTNGNWKLNVAGYGSTQAAQSASDKMMGAVYDAERKGTLTSPMKNFISSWREDLYTLRSYNEMEKKLGTPQQIQGYGAAEYLKQAGLGLLGVGALQVGQADPRTTKEEINKRYREAGIVPGTHQYNWIPAKKEEKEEMRQRLSAMAEGLGHKDMLDTLSDIENINTMGIRKNPLTGKFSVIVTDVEGDKTEMELNAEDASTLPYVTANDPFYNKFGANLYVHGNMTTETTLPGGMKSGESNAYYVPSHDNSKYQVRYHLFGSGDNNYKIKMYIRDNKGNSLVDGKVYSLMPGQGYMSPGQTMKALSNLEKDDVVTGIVQTLNPNVR